MPMKIYEQHTLQERTGVIVCGYSDDTFGFYWESGSGIDHDDCAAGTVRWGTVEFSDGSGLVFRGQHAERGGPERAGWTVGVAPLSEDRPTAIALACIQGAHTMRFSFVAPAGTRLTLSGEERS